MQVNKKSTWIYILLITLVWFACKPSPAPADQESGGLSAADSLQTRATIDALTAIADTARDGKVLLLIRIADLYKSLRDQDAWVGAQRAVFSFYNKNKQYEEAFRELDQAVRDIWWEPEAQAGQLYTLLGFTLRRLGRNYAASIYYEKARELSDRFGGVTRGNPAGPIYKTLANIKTRLGENEEAVKLFLTALDLLDRDTLPGRVLANQFTRVEIHSDLGIAYQNAGDLPEALDQYEAGLGTLSNLRNLEPKEAQEAANTRGMLLSNKASVLYLMGKPAAAESAIRNALAAFTPDKINYRFNAHNILADILEQTGEPAAAIQNRNLALALSQQGGVEQREIAKLLIEIGWSEYRNRNFKAAAHGAQQALNRIYAKISPDDIHENPDPGLLDPDPENATAEALDLKAEALWQLYQEAASDTFLQLADSTTALAIQMMENLRDAAVYESSKLNSSQQSRRLFNRMMAILYAQQEAGNTGAAARAVVFAEKSKAVLLQQKIAADAALRDAGVADSLIQQERDLKERRAYLQNQLFEKQITTEDLNDASILQLKRRVYAVEQSIRQLQNQMADTYQISINGQQQQTASVEDVRTKLLRKNERWIEYYTDPDSSQVYLISIGKNDLRFIRRPYQEAAVRTFIQLFNNEIQAENKAGDPALFAAFVAAARQLYSNLVEPAFSGEMPERLTLAPDGALALLPFDVLVHEPVPADAPVNYGELPYLVFSSQLRLVPSASLDLFYTHQAQTEVRGPYAGFAPDYSGSILGQVVSGSDVVKSAAAAFKGRAFIGPDAGLDAFLQTAPGHAIIHFHGHAEASDSFPDHSWMAFTAGRPIAETLLPQDPARLLGRRPGRLPASELEHCLFAHQVYYAHLNAELVLLSACQTGLGKIAPGEGTLSLSRAFQAAGCPATVMSLWEVRDDATAELMRLFLENIRLGQDKDEALTNAKRSYLKSTGDAFPYYWAGFVLTGKADPVRLSAPWWKSPFTWILLLGCLALALFIFRKKSSSRVME